MNACPAAPLRHLWISLGLAAGGRWLRAWPVLLLLLAPQVDAAGCSKTVGWDDSPQYSFADDAGRPHGIYIELAGALLRRLGCEPVFVRMPVARVMVELEAGRLDLRPGMVRNEERTAFAHFSAAIELHPNRLFVSQAAQREFKLRRLADIKGTRFRLGVQTKASYGIDFDLLKNDPAFSAQLVPAVNRRSVWKMMAAGRLDGFIAEPSSALDEIRADGLEGQIVMHELNLATEPARIALSKRSTDAEFLARFEAALAELTASGELAQIFLRHGRCPSVGPQPPCRGGS